MPSRCGGGRRALAAEVIIRGARVIDPATRMDRCVDLAIRAGRIQAMARSLTSGDGEEVAADGCVLAPALIDAHVHLREPGQPHKETIASGTAAAARGGFGTVACMANTRPPVDTPQHLALLWEIIRRDARVAVWPVAALTRELRGQELADLEGLAAAGAVAFSDDGRNAASPDLLAEGLRRAARLQRPVLVHAELEDQTRAAPLHDGRVARQLNLPGWPRAAEEEAVDRALWALARAPGAALHLQHLSSAGSVARVRAARAAGLSVTAEVSPHHLALTEEAVLACGALAKVNPPLREESDRCALVEAVCDQTISVIATDHAPHEAAAKGDLRDAAFGIAGLETALALCLRVSIPLPRLIDALTAQPARLLRAARLHPQLRVGEPASCVLFDPDEEWTVSPVGWRSRGANTPFMGQHLRGRVRLTILDGRVVHGAEVPVG